MRTDSRGGGVSIYTHKTIKCDVTENLVENGNHYLWLKIDKLSLNIGAIYKPPDTNVNNFLEEFNTQLETRKRSIILGDFNIDLLNKNNTAKKYLETIKESGYDILNKIAKKYNTRETPTTKTILDHVCTDIGNHEFGLTIINSSLSDHKQIFTEISKLNIPDKKRIKYEALDYEGLYKTTKETINLSNITEYGHLEQKIIQNINNNKIAKTKILNAPRNDWINKDILDEIDKRNCMGLQVKMGCGDVNSYQALQKSVKKSIKTAKKQYYHDLFKKCSNNSKKTWELLNTLARNKTRDDSVLPKLVLDGVTIDDGVNVCEAFNRFFLTVGSNLANKIPDTYRLSTTNILMYEADYTHDITLSQLRPCNKDEVSKIIDDLDSNSSAGIDGVSTKAIKCIKEVILEPLTCSINDCLAQGLFPDTLKIAKVKPIYKSGNKTDPGNYRPISVLPVISKVFERIIYCRLFEYLNQKKFFSENQYGFRPKSSTLSATVDLVNQIKSNIDKKLFVLGVFIDLKKAFDTISHLKLIQKLTNMAISGTALKILQSYLENRSQVVKIGNFTSSTHSITFGIPQGSILGPLLFLIYVNNISNIGLSGHVTLYADDTCLFYFGHSIHDIIAKAQKDLDMLNVWYLNNLLTINVSKTSYIIFTAKNKKVPNFTPLTINNTPIRRSQKEKYLGLWLDEKLTWGAHIDHVRNKLKPILGSLRKVSHFIPQNARTILYNSLVKSNLQYLIEVWGSASGTALKDLQILQNKIIKVLYHLNFYTQTKLVYKKTKIFNIEQLYKYTTCILVKKIITKTIHTNINITQRAYTHSLRNTNKLWVPIPRTKNYGRKNFTYEGVNFYNKLPEDIKNSESINIFKNKLKALIHNEQ